MTPQTRRRVKAFGMACLIVALLFVQLAARTPSGSTTCRTRVPRDAAAVVLRVPCAGWPADLVIGWRHVHVTFVQEHVESKAIESPTRIDVLR